MRKTTLLKKKNATDVFAENTANDSNKNMSYAPRVVSAQNIWIMNSITRNVIKSGTGRRALQLKRNDLSGKTGTTNDQHDAWFSGFNAEVVTICWVGFDKFSAHSAVERPAQVQRYQCGLIICESRLMAFLSQSWNGQVV